MRCCGYAMPVRGTLAAKPTQHHLRNRSPWSEQRGPLHRKLLRLRRERGSIAPIGYQRGPKPKLSERQLDRLCSLVAEQPDLTLEEIRRRLRLPLSISRLSAILIAAGFTRKKSPSPRASNSVATC